VGLTKARYHSRIVDAQQREVRDLADGLVRSLQRIGVMLTYDRDGVKAVDEYVESNRVHWTHEDIERLAVQIGCFVGECAVAVYGATWTSVAQSEEVGVRLSTGDTAFPITKAYKFLEGGSGDSVLSFFDVMGTIIAKGGITAL
jgi:hypothetical protein